MAVTPKISDLKAINELLLSINQLEQKITHNTREIAMLKEEYKIRLTREESALSNKLISKKRLAAFEKVINGLVIEEIQLLDSVKPVEREINDYIYQGQLRDYISELASKLTPVMLVAGDDIKDLIPHNFDHNQVIQGLPGQLRLKTDTKLYIFDPHTLKQQLLDRAIQAQFAE